MSRDVTTAAAAHAHAAASSSSSSSPVRPSTPPSSFVYDEHAFAVNHCNAVRNRMAMSLRFLISGDVQRAVLLNYCWDVDWIMDTVPAMQTFAQVDIVGVFSETSRGGSGSSHHHHPQPSRHPTYPNVNIYTPWLPIAYGVHHSKIALLFYNTGIRVIICTANYLQIDWRWKNQAIFVQDFPTRNQHSPSTTMFGTDLAEYMHAYHGAGLDLQKELARFDFSGAKCLLIGSVPGTHTGDRLHRWGHMRLRTLLARYATIPTSCNNTPIVCQFSSIGSVSEKWLLDEFRTSLAAHTPPEHASTTGASFSSSTSTSSASAAAAAASSASSKNAFSSMMKGTLAPLKLIWPTVEQVRHSLEGWAAGGSLCADTKNIHRPYLRHIMHVWDGSGQDRDRAMPHIKSYVRVNSSGEVAWVLITSANLSVAAWGQLQKQNTQLHIRHYELGCLFTPTHYAEALRTLAQRNLLHFSCTPDQPISFRPLHGAFRDMTKKSTGGGGGGAVSVNPFSVRFILQPDVNQPSQPSMTQGLGQQASGSKRSHSESSSTAAAAVVAAIDASSTIACTAPKAAAASQQAKRQRTSQSGRSAAEAVEISDDETHDEESAMDAFSHSENGSAIAAAAAAVSPAAPNIDAAYQHHASDELQLRLSDYADDDADVRSVVASSSSSVTADESASSATAVAPAAAAAPAATPSSATAERVYTIVCPLPYNPINPRRYTASDEPWAWDQQRHERDSRGHMTGPVDRDDD